MFNMLVLLLLAVGVSHALRPDYVQMNKHPDVGLNTGQMIERQGYPVELHTNIQTSDGYLLDVYRIPYGKNNSDQHDRPVVFLMHGLLCSSADWVIMGPEKALAYVLADAGYDVWMGNARGNTYSRKHVTYDPDRDTEFWNFSWHEIGTIDLPTMLDYVLAITGRENLYYVGHSQGTTSFFVMASERPEYNAKVRLMVALAPVVYMSHLANPLLQLISVYHNSIEWILKFIGLNEYLPSSELLKMVGQMACRDESLFQSICSSVIFMTCGWNSQNLNETMLPVILSSTPAGASTKQLVHYGQEIQSAKFRRYDYGVIRNILNYGTISPPDYVIKNIAAPVGLFYSKNDWLAAIVDVQQLASEISNLAINYLIPDAAFNHLDYIYGINMKEVLYDRVVALIEQYRKASITKK